MLINFVKRIKDEEIVTENDVSVMKRSSIFSIMHIFIAIFVPIFEIINYMLFY